jgi:type VI secretion system protein ImpK
MAVSAVLLLLMYFGFSLSLNTQSDPVYARLHNIARNVQTVVDREPVVLFEPTPPVPISHAIAEVPPKPSLRELLSEEIEQQKLTLNEDQGKFLIQVEGDGLFSSGSVQVEPGIKPLLERIALALNETDGAILVVGHTDNVPIRSLRFPSNWHLSRARSKAVAGILEKHLTQPERIRSEGLGSAEPLVPNDSRENRARNRRVEILLLGQKM